MQALGQYRHESLCPLSGKFTMNFLDPNSEYIISIMQKICVLPPQKNIIFIMTI